MEILSRGAGKVAETVVKEYAGGRSIATTLSQAPAALPFSIELATDLEKEVQSLFSG
jgi:hypothetical protein